MDLSSKTTPTIVALNLTKFRKGAEKAACWLMRENFDALFLNLPRELEGILKVYMLGDSSVEDFWRNYYYLTGLQRPFVNALRYAIDPLVNALPELYIRNSGLKVYCYQSLENHIVAMKLSERLLFLEAKDKVSSRIRVEDWRKLLRDEIICAGLGFQRNVENIAEEAISHASSVVLYEGLVKPFKDSMEAKGFKVRVLHILHYWRSPLEVLRIVAWTQGVDSLSDETIERCVRCHLRYLDHVICSKNIDAAHERWTAEAQPGIPRSTTEAINAGLYLS